MAQEPGWSSSPLASGLTPDTSWTRDLRKRYGSTGGPAGRQDDVLVYGMQKDNLMNQTSGFSSRGRSGGGSDWLGSGSVNMRFGGGNTPSNPGDYNYNTLNNTIGGAAEAVKWGFDTRSKIRNNQEKQDRIQTLKNARSQKEQDAQKNQNLNAFANKTLKQSRDLQANNFATRTKFKRGSASSAPATTINLLDSKAPGGFPASYFNKQTPPQTP